VKDICIPVRLYPLLSQITYHHQDLGSSSETSKEISPEINDFLRNKRHSPQTMAAILVIFKASNDSKVID
jgi:hypothetical protein